MTKQVDTSRGCTGCGPGLVLIVCLVIVVAIFAIALGGNK